MSQQSNPWRVKILKRELKTFQELEAQVIGELRDELGEPQSVNDYEGEFCTKPPGQGWPVCPFGNPGNPSPHCCIRFRQLLAGEKDYGPAR